MNRAIGPTARRLRPRIASRWLYRLTPATAATIASFSIPKASRITPGKEKMRRRPCSGSIRVKSGASFSGRKRNPTWARLTATPAANSRPKSGNSRGANSKNVLFQTKAAPEASSDSQASPPSCCRPNSIT